MKKIIFLFCFLSIVSYTQAEGLKGKLALNAKTAYAFALEGTSPRGTYFSTEFGYYVDRQLLLGLNFDYLEYHKSDVVYVEIENSEQPVRYVPGEIKRWYSVGLYSKLFFDANRFTPFVRMGFGLYIPHTTSYLYRYSTQEIYYSEVEGYEKTCVGMNFGAGFQYRLWKGLCLQTEGLLTTLMDRNKESDLNRNFTYANLNAGLSIIF